MKRRSYHFPVLVFVLGVVVLIVTSGIRTYGNRPDLFPFLWWVGGFLLGQGVLMSLSTFCRNPPRRDPTLWDDYGRPKAVVNPWAKHRAPERLEPKPTPAPPPGS